MRSDTFMDAAAVAVRIRRRVACEMRRASEPWLHAVGITSHGDVVRLMNQVASLERRLRELGRELERMPNADDLRRDAVANGSRGGSRSRRTAAGRA